MTSTNTPRVPLEDRTPVGAQIGTCQFPLDEAGHVCGDPVYAKSLHGRAPKYCDGVVDGVAHTSKKAATERKRLGLAAPAKDLAPAPIAEPIAPAAPEVPATDADQDPVSEAPAAGPADTELAHDSADAADPVDDRAPVPPAVPRPIPVGPGPRLPRLRQALRSASVLARSLRQRLDRATGIRR